jgi:hypothetical protein
MLRGAPGLSMDPAALGQHDDPAEGGGGATWLPTGPAVQIGVGVYERKYCPCVSVKGAVIGVRVDARCGSSDSGGPRMNIRYRVEPPDVFVRSH